MPSNPVGQKRVAVIGAGWSGCTAALYLAENDIQVTVFERANMPGGRARKFNWTRASGQEIELDNGQHILLGAYRETLRAMEMAGVKDEHAFLTLTMQMNYPLGETNGMQFQAMKLPAPLHLASALLRAKGLSAQDKWALAKFSTAAKWIDWKLTADFSVTQLLEQFGQTPKLFQLLWRPLCVAALNTEPDQASAQVFLNVMRDSLGASRRASDMLIPRENLSDIFPTAARQTLKRQGHDFELGCAIKSIHVSQDTWLLTTTQNEEARQFDAVIIASDPENAKRLLNTVNAEENTKHQAIQFPSLEYEPITTVYLEYPESLRLAKPFFALVEYPENQAWGQFVFDRGHLQQQQAGLFAVVISASSSSAELNQLELANQIALQLSQSISLADIVTPNAITQADLTHILQHPLQSKVITEKRATFKCTPALERPRAHTPYPGLMLTGDYVADPSSSTHYPATLESAVRSGRQTALDIVDFLRS